MTLQDAMKARHSVRQYRDEPIAGETLARLRNIIDGCNREGGLRFQLQLDEPDAFTGFMARYGKFENAKNYIALVGSKAPGLEERCGYYGEKVVLAAQGLGLNTCWIGGTYSKKKTVADVGPGEKLVIIIAIGYGQAPGEPHESKPLEAFYRAEGTPPGWFLRGVEAARLAPTAMNQQKFLFELEGNAVKASTSYGFYAVIDLGIAKYHFEIGAGDGDWWWA